MAASVANFGVDVNESNSIIVNIEKSTIIFREEFIKKINDGVLDGVFVGTFLKGLKDNNPDKEMKGFAKRALKNPSSINIIKLEEPLWLEYSMGANKGVSKPRKLSVISALFSSFRKRH